MPRAVTCFELHARPAVPVRRVCTGCGAPYLADLYRSRAPDDGRPVWRPFTRCKPCRNRASTQWYYAHLAHSRSRAKAWSANARRTGRYGLGHWWGHSPTLNLYAKLRRAGIERDEARSIALRHWRALGSPGPSIVTGKSTGTRVAGEVGYGASCAATVSKECDNV